MHLASNPGVGTFFGKMATVTTLETLEMIFIEFPALILVFV